MSKYCGLGDITLISRYFEFVDFAFCSTNSISQDGRLTRHILRLPIFVNKAFKQIKRFFLEKTLHHSLKFFQNSKFSSFFCRKILRIRAEKTFQEIIPFEKHPRKKLPDLAILKNFKFKNPSIFPKKPNFERFKNSYFFSRILRQICYNLFQKIFTFRNLKKVANVA